MVDCEIAAVVEGRTVVGRAVVWGSIVRRSVVRRPVMRGTVMWWSIVRRSMMRRVIMITRTMMRRLFGSLRRTMVFIVILRSKAIKKLRTLRIEFIHRLVHPRIHIKVFISLRNLGINFLLHVLHLRQSGVEDVLGLRSDRAEGFSNLIWG